MSVQVVAVLTAKPGQEDVAQAFAVAGEALAEAPGIHPLVPVG